MNAPSTFFGKCITLLVGGILSWYTVTNPRVSQLADYCLNAGFQMGNSSAVREEGETSLDGTVGTLTWNETEFSGLGLSSSSMGREKSPDVGASSLALVRPAAATASNNRLDATSTGDLVLAREDEAPQTLAVSAAQSGSFTGSMRENRDIRDMSEQLRRMGASYLLVERLPSAASVGESMEGPTARYRARCDLDPAHASVQCCFEAIRDTPFAALQALIDAVRNLQPASLP